jgi:hypothetical protein
MDHNEMVAEIRRLRERVDATDRELRQHRHRAEVYIPGRNEIGRAHV